MDFLTFWFLSFIISCVSWFIVFEWDGSFIRGKNDNKKGDEDK